MSIRPDKPLTEKQSEFVRLWFETGNQTTAYRTAYEVNKTIKLSAHARSACKLAKLPHVRAAYDKMRTNAQKKSTVTVATIEKMLRRAYGVAKKDLKPGGMVQAAMGLTKLYGLDAETQHRMSAEADSAASMTEVLRELARRLPD